MAIWHDIADEGRSVFYDWHGEEHMAERLAIKGFLRGRRYIAEKADLEFFNLYETTDLDVLEGEDYRQRLNNPTPWTVETVQHFRDVNRSLCMVSRSAGVGGGGLVHTVRYDAPAGAEDALWGGLLAPLAQAEGVAGVHLLSANKEASGVSTAESEARGRPNIVPTRAVLVEGWGDRTPFANLCNARLSDAALREHGAIGPIQSGLYRLQFTIDAPTDPA
ncbi:MAG: hypothetical protein AAGF49_01310 [Pseudomonadota bacterium]